MVLAEHTGGQVCEGTHELIGKAHELASVLGGLTEVALLGRADLAGQLGGADIVVAVDHPALSEYLPEPYERTLLEVLAQRSPRLLLISHGTVGLDLAAALSVRWDAPLATYVSALEIEEGTVTATAQILGGKVLVDIELPGERAIATVLGGAFGAEPGQSSATPKSSTWRRRPGSTRRACRFDRSSRPMGETSTSARPTCSSRWVAGSSRRTTWRSWRSWPMPLASRSRRRGLSWTRDGCRRPARWASRV